jgi:hypothetical protein
MLAHAVPGDAPAPTAHSPATLPSLDGASMRPPDCSQPAQAWVRAGGAGGVGGGRELGNARRRDVIAAQPPGPQAM